MLFFPAGLTAFLNKGKLNSSHSENPWDRVLCVTSLYFLFKTVSYKELISSSVPGACYKTQQIVVTQ